MTAEWRRIRGILDELINNAFEAGATSVRSDIEDEGNRFIVRVRDNGRGMSPEIRERANKLLSEPRRRELEEYYGHLAGKTAKSSGLTIVGMMVDEHTLSSEEGRGTDITVVIRKESRRRKDGE